MSESENVLSPEIPYSTTLTVPTQARSGCRHLRFGEAGGNQNDDPQRLILAEVKKTNSSLDNMSNRIDAMEGRLIAVELKQTDLMTPNPSSSGSSAEKTKKNKVPTRIRVSD